MPNLNRRPSKLGPIIQLCFVHRDFKKALDHWITNMGAGPFFVFDHIKVDSQTLRGKPMRVNLSVAIGYLGDMQIELLDLHDDGPSIYREFLDAGNEGLHHVGIEVSSKDEVHNVCSTPGWEVLSTVCVGETFATYTQPPGSGPIVEVVYSGPNLLALFEMMRAAARDWDGRDPLRTIDLKQNGV